MHAGLKLKGQFRFDLYDKDKRLLKSSDYIDNFITNSGLLYSAHFAFADCFRFLSAGNGNLQNNIIPPNDTTGLQNAIPELTYIGGRNFFNSNSTNYSPRPSCGYRFPRENIVELYRGWILPNNLGGEEGEFKTEGTISELMVSPGRPYVYALNDEGGIKEKLCSCSQNAYDSFFNLNVAGKDCSSIADYYNFINYNQPDRLKICDAVNAFARVVLDEENTINYVSGTSLNVTYKLTISVDSGIYYQEMFNNSVSSDQNFKGQWNFVKGITQLGLKLINGDPDILSFKPPYGPQAIRLQHYNYIYPSTNYLFGNEYGESFVPPHGIPLEPSTFNIKASNSDIDNLIYFFSENNTQFLVSEKGGKFEETGEFAPWNIYNPYKTYNSGQYAYIGNLSYQYINQIPNSGKPLNDTNFWKELDEFRVVSILNSGIKKFKNDTYKSLVTDNYWSSNPNEYNIRFKNSTIPNTGDILYSTNFDGKIISGFSKNNPTISEMITTSNNRKIILETILNYPRYTSSTDFIIKSFISAYRDINVVDVYYKNRDLVVPFFDSLYSGSGESIFLPIIQTGNKNYDSTSSITGASIINSDNDQYFYLSAENGRKKRPVLYTSLSWSTDCPSSANGC